MFYWKFTRNGKYSKKYISLVLDWHQSYVDDLKLKCSFDECKQMLLLIQDVEYLNGLQNSSSGVQKPAYRSVVNSIGYDTTADYLEQRQNFNLVKGQMILGNHRGNPLDYGKSTNENSPEIVLDIIKLQVKFYIDAQAENNSNFDKLKAYRNDIDFVNDGRYFDLMPKHSCLVEIIEKMKSFNHEETENFLINTLKWIKLM